MAINTVVIGGRLGKNPELRSTTGGKSVASFSIAVDDGYGDRKKTFWFYVEVWDKTAEAVDKLAVTGNRVVVTGRLVEDTWKDQEGNKKSRIKVLANSVEIIDFPEKENPDGYSASSGSDVY